MKLYSKTLGEGQPIILLHGLFGAADNLGMVARPLAEHFRAISVDLRNHGRSPHSDTMNYPAMAEDVVELTRELGLDSCHILGHSMGGKVSMQLALDHPNLVKKLVVADIAPTAYQPHHGDIFRGLQRLEGQAIASRTEADQVLAEIIRDMGTRQFLLTNLVRQPQGGFGLRLNLQGLIDNVSNISAAPQGNPFAGPTLFIRGGNSDYIRGQHKPEMDQLFPNHELVTIADAGHWLHAEQTAMFNTAVQRFLLS